MYSKRVSSKHGILYSVDKWLEKVVEYDKIITWEVTQMSKYSMIMSWSEEDQAYIVSVPELPGCMADGKTPEEAVKEAQTVIELWIETALEDGETIPEPHLFNDIAV